MKTKTKASTIMSRFEGAEGRRRLTEAMLRQPLVAMNRDVSAALIRAGKLTTVQKGESFIKQDASDNDIYFIIAGRAEVTVKGHFVATREAGTFVGEMAAIDHGAPRSATVTALEECVLLSLTEPRFSGIADKNPYLWRCIASELGMRLRQRGLMLRPPNSVPELFIGSTTEQLQIAQAIQAALDYDKVVPTIWTDSVFGPSGTPAASLLKQLHKSDFAILVLGDDDVVKCRGKRSFAPRDNIIFELGLFMGRLGLDRVFMLKKRGVDIKMPTDLLGVGVLDYEMKSANLASSLGPACTKIRDSIRSLGPVLGV